MVKISFVIVFISCLLCCTSGAKEEVVNLSEITTSSERYKEGDIKSKKETKEINTYDSLNTTLKYFIDTLGINKESIEITTKFDFIDRFENETQQKINILFGLDSVSMNYWEFKDSVQTMNAFYNWLDLNNLSLYEASKMKGESFKLLVYPDKIIKFHSLKSVKNDLFLKGFSEGLNFKFFIEKDSRNQLKWFKVESKKLVELKK